MYVCTWSPWCVLLGAFGLLRPRRLMDFFDPCFVFFFSKPRVPREVISALLSFT